MLMELGDDDAPVVYGPPDPSDSPTETAFTRVTPESTITIYPVTSVRPATPQPRPAGKVSKALDVVLPKKLGAGGKVTIWGLPPAVAYTLVAVILAGGGFWAYQQLGGKVARNPRRRGRRGRGRARSKR